MHVKVKWPCRPPMITEVVLHGGRIAAWDPVADAWLPVEDLLTDAQAARIRRHYAPRRVRIRVALVGQNHGVIGQVVALNGRTIAEGLIRPWSCPTAARGDAEDIIARKGWVLVQSKENA